MLTKNELKQLRNEIVLNSLFIKDYSNSLGVGEKKTCDFFSSFAEYIDSKAFEKCSNGSDYYEELERLDNIDELWNYYIDFENDPLKKSVYIFARKHENESDIYFDILKDDLFNMNAFIGGNRDFCGINSHVIKKIYDNLLNYSDYDVEVYYKNNIASYICDAVRQITNQRINVKKALEIVKSINEYNNNLSNREEATCEILSVIYGVKYISTCLRGCCQRDWDYLFIPKSKESLIKYIEGVYFNTGYEIEVNTSYNENEYNLDDDLEGDYFYSISWRDNDIKNDILNFYGYSEDDVIDIIFYDIDSYRQVTKIIYKETRL